MDPSIIALVRVQHFESSSDSGLQGSHQVHRLGCTVVVAVLALLHCLRCLVHTRVFLSDCAFQTSHRVRILNLLQ
jgi:hypothetical protein